MTVKFTALGNPDLSRMFPPPARSQRTATRQACLIECDEGDGYRSRLFGELTVDGDGAMTFIQKGPTYLLEPRPDGGEVGDK